MSNHRGNDDLKLETLSSSLKTMLEEKILAISSTKYSFRGEFKNLIAGEDIFEIDEKYEYKENVLRKGCTSSKKI